jgi:DNA-binding MarR family transcriptional regulator
MTADEIVTAARRIEARLHEGFGLTMTQYRILRALQNGASTIGEVCAGSDTQGATVTMCLDILERKRLVERVRSTNDRRVIIIRLLDHAIYPAAQEAIHH